MDKFQKGYAGAFKETPRGKYHSEATVGARISRLFAEQPPEQYVANGTVIFNPKNYDDVGKIIDHLKRGEQVIVDFSSTNQGVVARILDFMSGAVYALGGSVRKINADIFLFAPSNMAVAYGSTISK